MKKEHPIIENEHKEMPFYICRLEKASLNRTGNATTIEVYLNSKNFLENVSLDETGMSTNPWIELLTKRKNPSRDFLKRQLELFEKGESVEIADENNPIRWVGSGALLILETADEKQYAVLNKRHPKFAWGNFYDANGGYSSSIVDMLNPDTLAKREVAEEIKIEKRGNELKFDLLNPSALLPKNPVQAIIHFKGQTFITDNLILIIDPETGTIDFRQILKIRLETLEGIVITDHEEMFADKTSKISQKRPILTVPLEELIAIRETNRVITLPEFTITQELLTPSLKAILENL